MAPCPKYSHIILYLFHLLFAASATTSECFPPSPLSPWQKARENDFRRSLDELNHACARLSAQFPSYRSIKLEYTIERPTTNNNAPITSTSCKSAIKQIFTECDFYTPTFRGGWAVVDSVKYIVTVPEQPLWDLYISIAYPRFLALQNILLLQKDNPELSSGGGASSSTKKDKDVSSTLAEFERFITENPSPPHDPVNLSPVLDVMTKHAPGFVDTSPYIFVETMATSPEKSDAYFDNVYAPKAGMVVAVNNWQNTKDSVVAVAVAAGEESVVTTTTTKWSDVAFAIWRDTCLQYHADVAGLRWVYQDLISNRKSKVVMAWAMKGRFAGDESGIDDGGITWFSIYDEDPRPFFALSMTPNGVGAYWLAYDFPEGLGVFPARIGLVRVGERFFYVGVGKGWDGEGEGEDEAEMGGYDMIVGFERWNGKEFVPAKIE